MHLLFSVMCAHSLLPRPYSLWKYYYYTSNMKRTMPIIILKLLLILLLLGWISIWVLKPTELWTRKWKVAEQKASASVFGYNGLDFAVYTFPGIALAVVGYIYLDLRQREPTNRKGRRSVIDFLHSPLILNKQIGILNGTQIVVSSLFVVFLVWTFYVRISNDFEKITPIKSLKLNLWQYKVYKMATRCGLLAEACLALLLLPILRGMSIFRLINVQFEASVRYHIWLGTVMVVFSTLHGVGTFFIWGLKHRIQDEIWKWQKKGRIYLAGEIALLTALVIWITSLPQIRRKKFEVFYYTHHLYVVFFVFFLFHGGDRHFYMVFPGVFLFAIDKLLRIVQSRPETCVLSARVFPCNVIELTLPKDPRMRYTPTSVIFLKVPSISKLEWHPFSITSCSSEDDDTISVLIKSEGEWTQSLYEKIGVDRDSEADQRLSLQVAVEGPHGPASSDFFLRYDNLLLVAGGIGITPFISILREIYYTRQSNGGERHTNYIQLIYCVKNSNDVSLLDPILPQLFDFERSRIKLTVFVTREKNKQSTANLRQVLDEIPKIQTTYFDTSCIDNATYGTENLIWMALITMVCAVTFLISLACFSRFLIPNSKKRAEQKTPSSLVDLILICSFVIALFLCSVIANVIRRRRMRKAIGLFSAEQSKAVKLRSLEFGSDLDLHKIHFGARPNFQDLFYDFATEAGESDVGVLVCGPEAMKESVGSACRSMAFNRNDHENKAHFSFHSLNFTL